MICINGKIIIEAKKKENENQTSLYMRLPKSKNTERGRDSTDSESTMF